MANRTKMTDQKMIELIDEISRDANTSRACNDLNISRTTFYDYMNADQDRWKPLYEAAIDKGTDALIDEARRRAYAGVPDAVYHQGQVVGVRRLYSDSLLMFLIKARRPEFRDRMIDIPTEGKFSLTINTEGKKDDGPGKKE